MTVENLQPEKPLKVSEQGILIKIRQRADALIILGLMQTRWWLIATGITIVAATYGIEFSGDKIKMWSEKRKDKR